VEIIDKFFVTFNAVYMAMISYWVVYVIIGLLLPAKKFKPTDVKCTYAFLIAARDEAVVIAQLIDSIKKQDYPQDKLTIFVCADRCTDNTAQVARDAGAIVYERTEDLVPAGQRRSKGYALNFMLENIKRDYPDGIETFDGAFMIDADNLVAKSFVTEYNKAFQDKKYDFFNCYINSKNNVSNFVAAFCSSEDMGANTFISRPRSILGVSLLARGRGVLYRTYMLADCWKNDKWCNISIDTNSSACMISKGYRSSYCEAAELFDEKPLTLRILFRQRMRYARGAINAFCNWAPHLIFGIFLPCDFKKDKPKTYKKRRSSPLAEFQKRFSCYESVTKIFPIYVVTFITTIVYPIAKCITSIVQGRYDFAPMFWTVGIYYLGFYFSILGTFLITIIREHRKMRCNPWKMLLYAPVLPLVSILLQYVRLYALLINVKWKPIPHVIGETVDDVTSEKTIAEVIYEGKRKKAGATDGAAPTTTDTQAETPTGA
jgi:cellulose synthase/poly-beta-1,6-N-acetylglucosamine synthase-like glycosyltransferase